MNVCWNLTNVCNRDCIYCFRELIEHARPLEDNMVILNKLYLSGVKSITYSGGEPFIYNGILELMEYAKNLGITNRIITNGKMLTKENVKVYLKDVDKLTFSIDSPSDYVNARCGCGKDHYKHIKEILPYIRESFPDLPIEINTVATNLNLQEVDFMFEAVGSELSFYGIKKWKILRFYPLRGYAKERQNFLNVPSSVFDAIKDKYDGKKAVFEISVRDHDSMEENLIVSPIGSLKKAEDAKEIVLVEDIISTSSREIKKKMNLGGHHV